MESGAVIRSAGTVGILQDHASFLPETEPRMKGWALGYTDDWAVTLRVEDPGGEGGGGPQCCWRKCLSHYEARESSRMDDPGLHRYNTWQVEPRGSLGRCGRGYSRQTHLKSLTLATTK